MAKQPRSNTSTSTLLNPAQSPESAHAHTSVIMDKGRNKLAITSAVASSAVTRGSIMDSVWMMDVSATATALLGCSHSLVRATNTVG